MCITHTITWRQMWKSCFTCRNSLLHTDCSLFTSCDNDVPHGSLMFMWIISLRNSRLLCSSAGKLMLMGWFIIPAGRAGILMLFVNYYIWRIWCVANLTAGFLYYSQISKWCVCVCAAHLVFKPGQLANELSSKWIHRAFWFNSIFWEA